MFHVYHHLLLGLVLASQHTDTGNYQDVYLFHIKEIIKFASKVLINHLNIKYMVKHIVMFKLKDTLSKDEKLDVMNRFKAAIEALPASISVIRKVFVGLNINEAEAWDICLESEFDSLDDVKFYAAHPDHVAAAGILKDAKQDRACVDYEC
jgi:hypothetical protein